MMEWIVIRTHGPLSYGPLGVDYADNIYATEIEAKTRVVEIHEFGDHSARCARRDSSETCHACGEVKALERGAVGWLCDACHAKHQAWIRSKKSS